MTIIYPDHSGPFDVGDSGSVGVGGQWDAVGLGRQQFAVIQVIIRGWMEPWPLPDKRDTTATSMMCVDTSSSQAVAICLLLVQREASIFCARSDQLHMVDSRHFSLWKAPLEAD